jgi:hypothetical protein
MAGADRGASPVQGSRCRLCTLVRTGGAIWSPARGENNVDLKKRCRYPSVISKSVGHGDNLWKRLLSLQGSEPSSWALKTRLVGWRHAADLQMNVDGFNNAS